MSSDATVKGPDGANQPNRLERAKASVKNNKKTIAVTTVAILALAAVATIVGLTIAAQYNVNGFANTGVGTGLNDAVKWLGNDLSPGVQNWVPFAAAGGGLALLLAGGYGAYRLVKNRKTETPAEPLKTKTPAQVQEEAASKAVADAKLTDAKAIKKYTADFNGQYANSSEKLGKGESAERTAAIQAKSYADSQLPVRGNASPPKPAPRPANAPAAPPMPAPAAPAPAAPASPPGAPLPLSTLFPDGAPGLPPVPAPAQQLPAGVLDRINDVTLLPRAPPMLPVDQDEQTAVAGEGGASVPAGHPPALPPVAALTAGPGVVRRKAKRRSPPRVQTVAQPAAAGAAAVPPKLPPRPGAPVVKADAAALPKSTGYVSARVATPAAPAATGSAIPPPPSMPGPGKGNTPKADAAAAKRPLPLTPPEMEAAKAEPKKRPGQMLKDWWDKK